MYTLSSSLTCNVYPWSVHCECATSLVNLGDATHRSSDHNFFCFRTIFVSDPIEEALLSDHTDLQLHIFCTETVVYILYSIYILMCIYLIFCKSILSDAFQY